MFTKHELETILFSLEGYIQGNDDDKLCDELVDKISDNAGWCIKSIDYTSNLETAEVK